MSSGKQIAKNTMYLYIRMFFVMLVSLYTVRVVIKTLGVVDYGIFTAVGGIVLMMSFLSQTITFAAQRYFSFELGQNNMQRLQGVFGMVLVIYVITAIVIAIIAEIVGVWFLENKMIIPDERLDAAHWVLHFSLLSFIFHILYTPYNAMIIAHENMKAYAYISIIEVLLKLGIVYLLVLSNIDKLTLYSFLLLCISIVIALIYIIYCYWYYHETHFVFKPNRKLFSELKYATGDYKEVLNLFYISSKYSFFLLYIIMVPLFFEIHFILQIWLGQVTSYMVDFSRLMLIYVIILSISNPISIVVQAAGNVKRYHGIVDSFTLLTLFVAYFFFLAKAPAQSVFYIMIIVFIIAHFIRLIVLKYSIEFFFRDYNFPKISSIFHFSPHCIAYKYRP